MTYGIQEYLLTSCSPIYQHSYLHECQYVTTHEFIKYFICSTICFTVLIHTVKMTIQIVPEKERPNTLPANIRPFKKCNTLNYAVNSRILHVKCICHILIHNFAIGDVDSLFNFWILIKCFLPPLVRNIYRIRQRNIGKPQR